MAELATRTVLLVIHIGSCFPELLNVARLLKRSGKYEPIFWFTPTYGTLQRDIHACELEHIAHLNSTAGSKSDTFNRSIINVLKHKLRQLPTPLKEALRAHILLSTVFQLWQLSHRLKLVRRIIAEKEIALLILGLDLAHYDTAVYIKAAHLQHRPAVIVTDIMTNAHEFGEVYYNNPDHSMRKWTNYLVGKWYPRWVIEHKQRRLLRLRSSGMVLSKEWLGLAPPLPWQIHSGYADAILVESEQVRRFGISNGLSAERLIATGTTSQDEMAQALRESTQRRTQLCQKLGLVAKPIILLAMPQDDHPKGYERKFSTYRDMVQFLVQSLTACENFNLVVCLHPSTQYEDIQYIEQWGAKISTEPTAKLVPLCDLYVATISSTIKWAVACGKPVVMYDYNCSRPPDFDEAKGVIRVETKEEFLAVLKALTKDQAYYADIVARQLDCAGQWGQLDGKANERIMALFDLLIEKRVE